MPVNLLPDEEPTGYTEKQRSFLAETYGLSKAIITKWSKAFDFYTCCWWLSLVRDGVLKLEQVTIARVQAYTNWGLTPINFFSIKAQDKKGEAIVYFMAMLDNQKEHMIPKNWFQSSGMLQHYLKKKIPLLDFCGYTKAAIYFPVLPTIAKKTKV